MSDQGFRARAAACLAAADAAEDVNDRRGLFNQAVYWHTLAIQTEALACAPGSAWANATPDGTPPEHRALSVHA